MTTPTHPPTFKTAIGLKPTLMVHQLQLIASRRAGWLQQAELATPPLLTTTHKPVSLVEINNDSAYFQGWKPVPHAPVASVCDRPLLPSESFVLDFGQHLAGYLTISLRDFGVTVDAPVRLALIFGEVPAEIAEPFDPFPGTLTRSWLQDEIINIDVVPATIRLPRRYAFRYVKVTVVSASLHAKFGFSGFQTEATTSADESRVPAFTPRNADEAALDLVARHTLRDCMQTVFEDGPKRDRRLWLGDLRLQALANYATYRNYDLVKRSLYLLAGTCGQQGIVSTCAFEKPVPAGDLQCVDYTALLAPTVLEYLDASGDHTTAEDLWPLVLHQIDFTLEMVNPSGLLIPSPDRWLFIDWQPSLDKQAAGHAVVLFGLKATWQLAEKLGHTAAAAFLPAAIALMESAARRTLWDDTQGVYTSGPERQISWASQAWMILAGVPTAEQARRSLRTAMTNPRATPPVSPYLYHYVVDALRQTGLQTEASELLHSYWGSMIRKGADTFWEVYSPDDDHLSPYNSHLLNSYCHAWSCTPAYLLRVSPPAPR